MVGPGARGVVSWQDALASIHYRASPRETDMTTMAPLRCLGLKEAVLSEDGKAVLLELVMANGQIFPLELDAGGVELLMRALFASAQALGGKAGKPQALADSSPAESVLVGPPDEFLVRAQPDGAASLHLRLGSVDLAVGLADRAALEAALRTAT